MTCGIYQITNTMNGKFYIGLSCNIERRWRQHKWGLDREDALEHGSYLLRRAFLKYEFLEYPERFNFTVIEECDESLLFKREDYWIKKLNPKYNITEYNPARKSKTRQTPPGEGVWIQYHNCDRLGYIPAESLYHSSEDEDYENSLSGVSTGKRAILNARGDTIFLIAGVGSNPKQYYLISRFRIEEIPVRPDVDPTSKGAMFYDGYGGGWVLNPPQLLNSEEFDEFKAHCGNFGFGFMSLKNNPYVATLESIAEKYKSENLPYPEYVESFYQSVVTVNPNERWALAGRGVAQQLIFLAPLLLAALIFNGQATKLLTFDIPDELVHYRGCLLVQTSDLEPSDADREAYLYLLEQIGCDEKTFPKEAIQGCVVIQNIYKYSAEAFAADADEHFYGNSIESFKDMVGMSESEVWCIEIAEPKLLSKAVSLPVPPDIYGLDLWHPAEEYETKAVRVALNDVFTSLT